MSQNVSCSRRIPWASVMAKIPQWKKQSEIRRYLSILVALFLVGNQVGEKLHVIVSRNGSKMRDRMCYEKYLIDISWRQITIFVFFLLSRSQVPYRWQSCVIKGRCGNLTVRFSFVIHEKRTIYLLQCCYFITYREYHANRDKRKRRIFSSRNEKNNLKTDPDRSFKPILCH